MKLHNLDYLGWTKNKTKGQEMEKLKDRYGKYWSRVNKNDRGTGEVVITFKTKVVKNI